MVRRLGCDRPLLRVVALLVFVLELAGCASREDRAKEHYERSMKLLSAHETAKAAIELRNAVRLERTLIEAWRALAKIDEAGKDWPHVVTDLRTIVELAPHDSETRLKLGNLLLLTGSSDEALGLVNAGLELDSSRADLHALKAAIMSTREDPIGANQEARTALALDPADADALMVLAMVRLKSGDAAGALSLLNNTSAADAKNLENNVGFQLLKLRILEQTGEFKSAEIILKRLVELNPQGRDYRKLLVNFYIQQNRIDDAEKAIRALTAEHPSDSEDALELVHFLYTMKRDPAAARAELDARINAGGDVFPFQMALADIDLTEGHLAATRKRLENLISGAETPENKQAATIALARTYLGNKELDTAQKMASDVLHDNPRNVQALKLRATIHLERAELDAAVTDLLEALNYQPRSTDLMMLLASAYERSGLIELADKQLADATRLSNFDASIGLAYAEFLQRRGGLARAEEVLIESTRRQPMNVQLLSMLGQVKLARQNWDGSQEVADRIRQAGQIGTADQLHGAVLIGRKNYDEAIALFRGQIDSDPTSVQPLGSLVNVLLQTNKRNEATALLKSLLAKNPRNATALLLLGAIELKTAAIAEAEAHFLAAVNAQPTAALGYQALANFYIDQKRFEEAIRVARAGLKQQPDTASLRITLARALEGGGQVDVAISEYDSLLSKQPTNLIVANNLASLLLDQKNNESSLKRGQSIAAILRKSPVPQFKDTLGWASYRQGDYKTAVSLCEDALTALPDQPTIRYHLGMSLIAAGQPAKASEQLKKALEMGPDERLIEDIRSALVKTGS